MAVNSKQKQEALLEPPVDDYHKAGSINYHRIIVSKFYEIRFVTFWILFGSKYKFAQSCSPLHSFTHLHFDLKNKSKI